MAELICELKKIPFQKVYQKLEILLSQGSFEILEKNRMKSEGQDIRVVFLMNDAVESFLVFKNARITGEYQEDEGILYATLTENEDVYVLILHGETSVCSIFFCDLAMENHLFNYGRIGHFWVEGYEYLRQLEYRLAILRDKADYLGYEYCNEDELRLVVLTEFPPLNFCCYPAVQEKYLVKRYKGWMVSERAIRVMYDIAKEADDESLMRALWIYRQFPNRFVAGWIARKFTDRKHAACVDLLEEKLIKASGCYPDRKFEQEEEKMIGKVLEKAKMRKKELEKKGVRVDILREEPFLYAKDSIEYKVHLMIWRDKGKKRLVEIETIYMQEN